MLRRAQGEARADRQAEMRLWHRRRSSRKTSSRQAARRAGIVSAACLTLRLPLSFSPMSHLHNRAACETRRAMPQCQVRSLHMQLLLFVASRDAPSRHSAVARAL